MKFINILTEKERGVTSYIRRITEAAEIPPNNGNDGGCLIRYRSKYVQRLFGIIPIVTRHEHLVFIKGITIKQLKGV